MTFFVDTFDTQAKGACLSWARDDYDNGDKWGWAMSWAFDVCAELSSRDLYDQPNDLQYRAGIGGVHIDDESRAQGLSLIGNDALEYFAKFLKRYIAACERKGLSY